MSRGRDGDDNSINSSLSAPPDAPSTEQYQPVRPHSASSIGHGGSARAGGQPDAYHARAMSFNSETDDHDVDEDTLTMPVPGDVRPSTATTTTHSTVAPTQRAIIPPYLSTHGTPPPLRERLSSPRPQQQQHFMSPPTTVAPPTGVPFHAAHPAARETHSPSPPRSLPSRFPLLPGTTATPDARTAPVVSPSQPSQMRRQSVLSSSGSVAGPPVHTPPTRSNIVNSSGYYYTTRNATSASMQSARAVVDGATATSMSPHPSSLPAATAPVGTAPLPSFMPPPPPSPTPMPLLQQQQQNALLFPTPYDRPSSPPPSLVQSLIPHPSAAAGTTSSFPCSASPSQWQLSSTQSNHRECHQHRHSGGAVFEYASEAVNTLEQQYSDALQRLTTMHRLNHRLDEQNKTLESEVVRLRRTNDLLQKGVAFNVYNSVRQVKHEMKLLRQYVAVLCTGFSNSMQALQQVVAEDVPRMLGCDPAYTALLPYGAQGRLRLMETRVSVGRGTNHQDAFAAPPPLSLSPCPRDVSAAAELRLYQPDYWWNAMSPQPLRPPSAQVETLEVAEEEEGGASSQLTKASDVERSSANRTALPRIGSQRYDSYASVEQRRHQQQQMQARDGVVQDTVSFPAYRQVQTALAEAQRRVVELEQQRSNEQADFEARVMQLKAAHKARESRLMEELALLKRVESIKIESDRAPQHLDVWSAEGDNNSGGATTTAANSTVSVDINTLTQLLTSLQLKQQTQNPTAALVGSTSVTGSTYHPPAERTMAFSGSLDEDANTDGNCGVEDDGMVDSRDPCSRSSSSATTNDDADYDFKYNSNDPRQSYSQTARRVFQATALGRNRPRTVRGDDGRLHRPDRYSSSAAARRAERARQVLGDDVIEKGEQRRGAEGRPSGALSGASRSCAYERSENRRYERLPAPSPSVMKTHSGDDGFTAQHTVGQRAGTPTPHCTAPRGRSQRRGDEVDRPLQGRDVRCSNYSGDSSRRGVHLENVDPALLQSVLEQISSNNISRSGGNPTYASKPSRGRTVADAKTDLKADRLAQGLWAQEVLRERHFI